MKVLFVCTANICRSPTAEGVFRKLVANSPLADSVDIDSAGTHDYHVGAPPDPRAVEHAGKRGYDLQHLRARQISPADFEQFDFVLAMDDANIDYLRAICPTRLAEKIELLLDYGGPDDQREVPDPYQGRLRDFERALDLIEAACSGLKAYLLDIHQMHATSPKDGTEP
ncbi:MAG: low molecular weight phosphotyrosine protein phosphatase [Burkholderiales bacterium]|nr:low molecular weight phosphotyrosine protein phosphatase [Burkholderiales bacterium]